LKIDEQFYFRNESGFKDQPNPGSREALELGCICPVFDNCYGYGASVLDDRTYYYVTAGCPIHDLKNYKEEEKNGEE